MDILVSIKPFYVVDILLIVKKKNQIILTIQ